ncbi:unnamed protein product, partial [Brenthis ino]
MDRTIAEMIALQNLPFHFVEGTGFRRVMQAALPKYKIRGRDFFSSYVCDNLYNKLAKKTKDLLEEFDKLSFTSDIWSELHSAVSLLSLTAHGISKDFRKKTIILKCEVMDERHTGTIISTKFQTILEEWGIDRQKVHCMVRDRGSNMVRAMQLSGFEDISCAIHQIQLCIRAGVESQEWLLQLIAKLKKIATHFNHSLVAQAELTKIQKERLNQSPLSVIQDCPTRWNSTFYMMARFSKLKDSLVLYLSANPIAMISPEDWMNIQKFVQFMQPFEEITRNLSSSQISISSVIPLIQVLKTTLQQEETKPNTSEQFINFITKLRDELNSSVRFGNLVEDDKYTIATYLDPRYKSHFFTSVIAEQVESKLLNMTINTIRTRQSNSIQDDDCEPSPKRSRTQIAIEDIEVQPSTSKSSASLQILESMLSVNEDQEEDSSTADDGDNLLLKIQSHLREYKKEKRLPLHEDPLMWWNGNAHKYNNILPIVRQYLSAPPSSVASEQLFSGAGLIYEEHRNRLKGEKAAKLLFIKYNLPLFNFDY